jgi:hypothetical protein
MDDGTQELLRVGPKRTQTFYTSISGRRRLTDGRSVIQSVCLGIGQHCGTFDRILLPVGMLLSEICGLVSVGRPLWREDGFELTWRLTVIRSVCLGIGHPCGILLPAGRLLSEICGLVSVLRPLWWEDGFEVTLWLTVSRSVCLGIEHPCGTCDRILLPVGRLLSEICGLVSVLRPLWREEESAICSVITHWSESLSTHNHTLLSHLRLPQPGGPGSRIYILQEQGSPLIPPGHLFIYIRTNFWSQVPQLARHHDVLTDWSRNVTSASGQLLLTVTDKRQTRPLVREGAPQRQDRKIETELIFGRKSHSWLGEMFPRKAPVYFFVFPSLSTFPQWSVRLTSHAFTDLDWTRNSFILLPTFRRVCFLDLRGEKSRRTSICAEDKFRMLSIMFQFHKLHSSSGWRTWSVAIQRTIATIPLSAYLERTVIHQAPFCWRFCWLECNEALTHNSVSDIRCEAYSVPST